MSGRLRVRLAVYDEIPLVHQIMQAAFAEYRGILEPPSGAHAESVNDVYQRIQENGGAVLGWLEEKPVASARFLREEEYLYIERLAVLPEYRGRGVAKALLDYLEQWAGSHGLGEVRLGVRIALPQNVEFYKKLRFEVVDTVYADGRPKGLTMAKQLARS